MGLLSLPVYYSILVLVTGVVVPLFLYPILIHLKHKPKLRSIITLFAMGIIGGIINIVLFFPLYAIFNWTMPWHYNPLSLPETYAVIILVLFLCFFPMALLLRGLKPRKALIVAGVATAIIVPAYWLGIIVASVIASAIP